MAIPATDVPRQRSFRPAPAAISIKPNGNNFHPLLVQIERRLSLLASPQMVTLGNRKIWTIPLRRQPEQRKQYFVGV